MASPVVLDAHENEQGVQLLDAGLPDHIDIYSEARLRLTTSVRSLRAKMVSEWVQSVLDGNAPVARSCFAGNREFPVVCTRDLNVARTWLSAQSGDVPYPGRSGLVASSGALRLRAYRLEVSTGFRHGFQYEEWFLAPPSDVRSAPTLEVAATEFECQGLELDWVGVCWGDDFLFDPHSNCWDTRRFVGSRWLRVTRPAARQFTMNKYRVLLTRARKGMIIWAPPGSRIDATRDSARLDATAEYLGTCGIPCVV